MQRGAAVVALYGGIKYLLIFGSLILTNRTYIIIKQIQRKQYLHS